MWYNSSLQLDSGQPEFPRAAQRKCSVSGKTHSNGKEVEETLGLRRDGEGEPGRTPRVSKGSHYSRQQAGFANALEFFA